MWYWILAWFLTIITIVGNGLVICLIFTIRRLQTVANWSVLSLAVADLFVGLTFFPLLFALNIDQLKDPPESLPPFFLVSRTFLYFSATNLFVMILDRYVAIVHPLKYLSFMTARVIKVAVAVAWISPILLFSVPYYLKVQSQFLLVFRVCIFQVLPVLVFIFVAVQIFCIMRRISKRTSKIFAQLRFNHAPKTSSSVTDSSLESRAAAKMTVAIVFFFIVCYAFENYKCFCNVFGMCRSIAALEEVIDILFVINSAANPIAYAFLKRDVKTVLQRMLARRKIHVQSGTETSSASGQEMKSSTGSLWLWCFHECGWTEQGQNYALDPILPTYNVLVGNIFCNYSLNSEL